MTYVKQLEDVTSLKVEVVNRSGMKLTVVDWGDYNNLKRVVGNSEETEDGTSDDTVEEEEEVQKEVSKDMAANAAAIRKVADHYSKNIRPARLTDAARRKIQTRLKTFSEQELLAAIDAFRKSTWRMENNSAEGMAWFFHSDDRIEKFMGIADMPRRESKNERGSGMRPIVKWDGEILGAGGSAKANGEGEPGELRPQEPWARGGA